MPDVTPIKRATELVPLSRDHHDGLLLCWKIKYGVANEIGIDRILNYTVWFYQHDLAPHFRQEEEYVFSLLADNDPMKIEALAQHDILNGMYGTMKDDTTDKKALLQQFAEELNNHIRFEERELFPYIEKKADKALLTEVGKKIEHSHQSNQRSVWEDEFWIKKR